MAISGKLYNILENYLSDRLQKVALNGQTSSWRPVLAGVPQSSILGSLLFLVYINDFPDELKSNAKLFADDTSLFAIITDKNESANILNDDLQLISKSVLNWKMLFNSDPSLNNAQVERLSYQKHLGIDFIQSKRWFFCFPIIRNSSIFSTHVK